MQLCWLRYKCVRVWCWDFLALQHQPVSLCVVEVTHNSWWDGMVKVCMCTHACVWLCVSAWVCVSNQIKEYRDLLSPPCFPCETIPLGCPWPNWGGVVCLYVCVCMCVCERICPIRTPLSSPTDSPFQPCWILFSLSGEPRPASGSPCYDRGYNNRPAIPLLSAAFRRGNLPRAQINYNTHTHKIDCSLQNKTFFRMPPLD